MGILPPHSVGSKTMSKLANNSVKKDFHPFERYTISKENLEPGDILLRLQPDLGDPNETFATLIDFALEALSATPPKETNETGFLRLLLSLVDGAGFWGAAVVGRMDTDDFSGKYVFAWDNSTAQRIPVDKFDSTQTMAFRFCNGAVALGDTRLPSQSVTNTINMVTNWALTQEKYPMTLVLLMLSTWRYRKSFEVHIIEELAKTLFGPHHHHTLDLFFHLSNNHVKKLIDIGAEKAASILFNPDIILGTDLIASIFNKEISGNDYHMDKNSDFDDLRHGSTANFCEQLDPELVSKKLRELTFTLSEWAERLPDKAGLSATQLFGDNTKSLQNRFLPSDFLHSKNTFPLGSIESK